MRMLITGATRGLGRATARAAARRGAEVLVTGRDPEAVARVAAEVGGQGHVLDLADPAAVRAAVPELGAVDVVAANAGLQIRGGPTTTTDGVEETLAVNVLGHVALVDALLAGPRPPSRVAFLGSTTHDPATPTPTPAPVESTDLGALARGELTTSGPQRYATTKLHCTALAGAYAREHPEVHWSCFDPGLMPGTGLARTYGPAARLLWSTVLRGVAVLPFASTPARSGDALARVLLDDPAPGASGAVLDWRLRPGVVSARAADAAFGDAVLAAARGLVAA
jgi:NAD(P)-dependent dehydrogenase (short-subunit alcohol dehydrogenase family)